MVEIILTSFQAGKVIFKVLATFLLYHQHILPYLAKSYGCWTNYCLKCISVTSESLDLFALNVEKEILQPRRTQDS